MGSRRPFRKGGGIAVRLLLPLWEKVGRVSGSDEGSLGKARSTPHPSLRDTFSRKGRRTNRSERQGARFLHVRQRLDFGQQAGVRSLVDAHQSDSVFIGRNAPEVEGGDVDAGLA